MANLREQTHTFTLNYLYAIDAQGGNATQGSTQGELLASLFLPANADDDDDASTWLTPPAGFTVEEVNVTGSDRRTDLEDHNLGWWEVTVEVRGHTYHTWPINALAAALDTRVHANLAAFTPDLVLVNRDDYWQVHVEGVSSRVPAVITQYQGTSASTTNF